MHFTKQSLKFLDVVNENVMLYIYIYIYITERLMHMYTYTYTQTYNLKQMYFYEFLLSILSTKTWD